MMQARLTEALKKHFGHGEFRRPQNEIVESIISGKDTLAIMPTGGGKSLCYQLPAMMLDGVTLVVSPLIALMKDQVDALVARGISAAMINSSQTWEEQREVLDKLSNGKLRLAYIAPERFRAATFMRALIDVKVGLFAVDEAHCISQWGHDFRPDYMRLGDVLEKLGGPVAAAFTATATPEVREDIVSQLRLREPSIFVSGFARHNLSLNVLQMSKKADKESRVRELVDKYKTGIVYCATRKSVESLSVSLWEDGVRHVIYHGGMTPSERDNAQEIFISGKENIAVATNAFGMGIDRADIRFVCHYELTGSVEALYQESGRAGRDGAAAYCEMLLMYADKRVQEFFIDGANPSEEYIRATYRVLRENSDNSNECTMPIETLAEEVSDILKFEGKKSFSRKRSFGKRGFGGGSNSANSMSASSAISVLRRYGFIDRFDIAGSRTRGTRIMNPDADESSIIFPDGLLEEKRRRDEHKLRDLLKYAYTKECRQQWILKYFGEFDEPPCGRCDNCKSGKIAVTEKLSEEELTEVRKALSGIARVSRRISAREWGARFGRERIQNFLYGSPDERLSAFGLDANKTYGILKPHGKKFVVSLFAALNESELVVFEGDEYPICTLSEKGVAVMFGEVSDLSLNYPRDISKISKLKESVKSKKTKTSDISELSTEDAALYKILCEKRSCVMKEFNFAAAYLVFSNAVLKELAIHRPTSVEAGLLIKGIGESKAKNILPPFLEVIKKYVD